MAKRTLSRSLSPSRSSRPRGLNDMPVEDRDSKERGNKIGMLCSLCIKHKTDQRNYAGTWTSKPCACIRQDVIDRHSKSAMHKEAVEKEALL